MLRGRLYSGKETLGAPLGCGYPEAMRVRLLYFGILKDMLGRTQETIELPVGTTTGALLQILDAPTSNPVWRSLAVAVNRQYSGTEVELQEGDEVALLPPVSGGAGRG